MSRPPKQAGFSLVEALLALSILSVLALAFTWSALYARGSAEGNIHDSTALTVAAGYLEQLKSIEYEDLVACVRSPSDPLPTMVNQGQPDPLYLGQFTEKSVLLNVDDAGKPIQHMTLWVMPEIVDNWATSGERVLSITITYRWISPDTKREQERILRTSRSFVPTF